MFVHFILFQVLCVKLVSLSSELAAVLQCGCILGLSREGIGEHRCPSEICPCVPWQAGLSWSHSQDPRASPGVEENLWKVTQLLPLVPMHKDFLSKWERK